MTNNKNENVQKNVIGMRRLIIYAVAFIVSWSALFFVGGIIWGMTT